MASLNVFMVLDKSAGLISKTVDLAMKWGLRTFAAAFTLQTGAMILHDQTAQTPEDVLRGMGYNPELLTRPLPHHVDIRMVQDNWLGKIRLYNRMQALSTAADYPSISLEAWEYATAFKLKTPHTISVLYDFVHTSGMAAMPAESPRQTALISLGKPDNFQRLSPIETKDGKVYSVFDLEDFRDINAYVLLHEWHHAANLTKFDPRNRDATHRYEIAADLYSIESFKDITGKDYTQKLIDFRILRAFYGVFGKNDSDPVHDTALTLDYQRQGKSVSQADVKKAFENIYRGYNDMHEMGLKLPENLHELYKSATYLRDNYSQFESFRNISAHDAIIMTDTLSLLADAAKRLYEKGPVQTNGSKRKFIISGNQPGPF